MKKLIVLLFLILSLFAFSGCQKEPSLADQIKQNKKETEEAKERLKEAKEKERQLELIVNGLKNH